MASIPPLAVGATSRLRDVFRAQQDERLLNQAVAAGFISADEAAQLADDGPGAVAKLVAKGTLSAEQVAQLERSLAQEAFARPLDRHDSAEPLPPEVTAAALDPGRHVGDFILVEARGRGGSGEVWRAFDLRLHRWVAVKLSTAAVDSGSGRERFQREALATAKLHHPNIVPVFQTGEINGRPYLVMPFIDGATLDSGLPLQRALEVMATVAHAVEEAHRHGLVHRDLKPANVMVDLEGRVFVLDFGLAFLRREQSSRLTQPGDLMGTAAYMAPEQARGDQEAPGVATDIYGLGSTLYFLVTGRPPFTGDSFAAVVARVIGGDAPRPSRLVTGLAPGIEAVIDKAMDRDPRRRYSSAAALAHDLERVRDGLTPQARPRGIVQRLTFRVRRHPVWVVTVVSLVVLGLVGTQLRARLRSEEQTALGALRDMARRELESAMELRRAGQTRAMGRALPRIVAAADAVRKRASGPELAEVEFLLGRIHRALLNDKEALALQERALRADPAYLPAIYERSVLLSAQYGRKLDETQATLSTARSGAPNLEAAEEANPVLAPMRKIILDDCAKLEAGETTLGAAAATAGRGLLAFHRQHYAEARTLLRKSLDEDPSREEIWEALARAEDADRLTAKADETFRSGIARDRGYLPFYVGRCDLLRRGNQQDASLVAAQAALAMDDTFAPAWTCLGTSLMLVAHASLMAGHDPLAGFEKAQHAFDEAIRHQGGSVAIWGRATLRRYRSIWHSRVGVDPTPDLDASLSDLEKARAQEPHRTELMTSSGRTLARRALWKAENDGDPQKDFEIAIDTFSQAIRAEHPRADALDWRGDARLWLAVWRFRKGMPVGEDFSLAVADLDRALTIYASDGWTNLHRGVAQAQWGAFEAAKDRDPIAHWKAARNDLTAAVQRLRKLPEPWLRRAELEIFRAIWQQERGIDAAESRVQAAFDIDRALALDPGSAEAHAARSALDVARGDLAAARAAWQRALTLNPRSEGRSRLMGFAPPPNATSSPKP